METANPQIPNLYPDEAMLSMLARPDIQAGLAGVAEATTAYYQGLEDQGMWIRPVSSGVTANGMCVEIASVTDGSAGAVPEYSVFTYPLENVASEDFAASLVPRKVVGTGRGGGRVELTLEDPTKSAVVYRMGTGPNGESVVTGTEEVPGTQSIHWQPGRGQVYFEGQLIRSFEDAALGDRRRAIVEEEGRPLFEAAREMRGNHAKALRLNAVAG